MLENIFLKEYMIFATVYHLKNIKTMEFDDQLIISNFRNLTYEQTGFNDNMLDLVDLERCCPLDNGRHDKQDITTPGFLDALPHELTQTVLLDLDLRSLTTLRRVNRCTRLTIDKLWQYKEIVEYASNCLRAVLSIEVDTLISCRQLHMELCSQNCVSCGRLGTVLYLLTCSRTCFVCMIGNPRFAPLTSRHARVAFGLSTHETRKLPTAITIPGEYSEFSKIRRKRETLVDQTSARLAGIRVHKTVERMEEYVHSISCLSSSSTEAFV